MTDKCKNIFIEVSAIAAIAAAMLLYFHQLSMVIPSGPAADHRGTTISTSTPFLLHATEYSSGSTTQAEAGCIQLEVDK